MGDALVNLLLVSGHINGSNRPRPGACAMERGALPPYPHWALCTASLPDLLARLERDSGWTGWLATPSGESILP